MHESEAESTTLPAAVASALRVMAPSIASATVSTVTAHPTQGNGVWEVALDDGRRLMVKQAAEPGEVRAADYARAARIARIWREADICVPELREVPEGDAPTAAYWRLSAPTLRTLWPRLSPHVRAEVLCDWGVLLRRMHDATPPAAGEALERYTTDALADLSLRLRAQIGWVWPDFLPIFERLRALVPALEDRTTAAPVLLHNDLHMSNVLCRPEGRGPLGPTQIRCIGAIDLEDAALGLAESDLGRIAACHHPLFGRPLDGRALHRIAEGYARPLDPLLIAFFRAYHLVNVGYHRAHCGQRACLQDIAEVIDEDVRVMERALR